MQTVRLVLIGLGNLGRRFCQILQSKKDLLQQRHRLVLTLVGAADSRGAAYDPVNGLDPGRVAALKASGGTIADYPDLGREDWPAPDLVATAQAGGFPFRFGNRGPDGHGRGCAELYRRARGRWQRQCLRGLQSQSAG